MPVQCVQVVQVRTCNTVCAFLIVALTKKLLYPPALTVTQSTFQIQYSVSFLPNLFRKCTNALDDEMEGLGRESLAQDESISIPDCLSPKEVEATPIGLEKMHAISGLTTNTMPSKSKTETFDEDVFTENDSEQDAFLEPTETNNTTSNTLVEVQVLTEDAYSLLCVANLCSRTTLFASGIIGLQAGLLLLILLDVLDLDTDNGNPLAIPPGVSLEVTISQFLGIGLSGVIMATDGDVMVGLTQLLFQGHNDSVFYRNKHATCFRWYLTGGLQTLTGLLMLVDSFVLTMQSTTVIDLVLNLTALHVIQALDDLAFLVAEMGLVGAAIQDDCVKVGGLIVKLSGNDVKHQITGQRWVTFLLLAALIIPYAWATALQTNGYFLCQNLQLKFGGGEELIPELSAHNGSFERKKDGFFFGTYGAYSHYEDSSNNLRIAYCSRKKAWTISKAEGEGTSHDPCNGILYMSEDTFEFDVTHLHNEWMINTKLSSTAEFIPAPHFELMCND